MENYVFLFTKYEVRCTIAKFAVCWLTSVVCWKRTWDGLNEPREDFDWDMCGRGTHSGAKI